MELTGISEPVTSHTLSSVWVGPVGNHTTMVCGKRKFFLKKKKKKQKQYQHLEKSMIGSNVSMLTLADEHTNFGVQQAFCSATVACYQLENGQKWADVAEPPGFVL